jgi:hypothetical protein
MKTAAAFLLLTTVAFADNTAKHAATPKEAAIRKLLQLTGAAALGAQVMNQLIDTFKQSMPNVPASFWPELAKELNPDELVERVIPVYDKQLTEAEINDLIHFYETPTGKKLIKVMPAITQESMQIGQGWGREIGQKVMQKLQKQGLDKK